MFGLFGLVYLIYSGVQENSEAAENVTPKVI